MNWLIIAEAEDKIQNIKKLLTECDKNAAVHCVIFDNRMLDASADIIRDTDYCIVLLADGGQCNSVMSYACGFFSGKKVPVYTTMKALADAGMLGADVTYYERPELIEKFIVLNYRRLAHEQQKKNSYAYLFQNGLPFTPACFASHVAKGKIDICRKYVEAGMDVNVRDAEGTPMLSVATRAEQIDCIEWLLAQGADINAVSEDRGYTALMDAVWRGNEEITYLLIKHGAKMNTVNKEGQTMLVLAVGAGRSEICRMLVQNGEDPDVRDSLGMSAYEYAKLFKKAEIVGLLEKYHKN